MTIQVIMEHWLPPLVMAPFVGSFLGTVILRLPAGRPVVAGRSVCAHCESALGPVALIPLFGWLLRRGRCHYCGGRISVFYPLTELAALLVAAWAVAVLPGGLAWIGCGLGWTLLTAAAIDLRDLVLPDVVVLPLLPIGLLVSYGLNPAALSHHAIGAIAGFLSLLAVGWAYRRLRGRDGLGLGDAKLFAAAGAWNGWQGLAGVMVWAAGLALAVVLLRAAAGQRLGRDQPIAFGPYLAAGLWLVWLYGPLVPVW